MSAKKHPDWEDAVKDVRPLKAKTRAEKPLPKISGRRAVKDPGAGGHDFHPTAVRPQSAFDPLQFEKLETGKVRLQFKHDLHGMTEREAHDYLLDALGLAFQAGKRYGLIVTGKGRDGQSPIRTMLPKWLGAPRFSQIVSSYCYAAKRHGGDGAFYILLRRFDR